MSYYISLVIMESIEIYREHGHPSLPTLKIQRTLIVYTIMTNDAEQSMTVLFDGLKRIYVIANLTWPSTKRSLNIVHILTAFVFVRLLSVLCGHSVFSSPPQRPMTSVFEGFSIPDFIHYIYFPIFILEKEPVFPFWRFSAKQGNYWYHFL